MKKIISLISFFILATGAYADGDLLTAGARYAGMAGSSVVLPDTWSVFGNQAGLAYLQNPSVGLSYENRFLQPETSYGALAFQMPLLAGNIGLGINHFGLTEYHENKFALSYAQQLFRRISMGVQFDYIFLHQPEDYGNLHAFSFELGLIAKPNDKIVIGIHAANPMPVKILNTENQYLPTVLKVGVGYVFSKSVITTFEAEQNLQLEKPVFRLGCEYNSERHYSIRAGIATNPVLFSLGFGYNLKGLQLDIAYSYHQVLGSTPHISVGYAF